MFSERSKVAVRCLPDTDGMESTGQIHRLKAELELELDSAVAGGAPSSSSGNQGYRLAEQRRAEIADGDGEVWVIENVARQCGNGEFHRVALAFRFGSQLKGLGHP